MRTQTRNSSKPSNGGFLDIVERYWLVLLGLIIGYPIIMRYFKDASTKDTINNQEEETKILVSNNNNPITQLQELNKITSNPFYHNIARNVAIDLGTNILTKETSFFDFAWLNPKSWTENDAKIYAQLKILTGTGQVKTVTQCYYVLTRRNLMDDVKKYLDSSELNKLPLFK